MLYTLFIIVYIYYLCRILYDSNNITLINSLCYIYTIHILYTYYIYTIHISNHIIHIYTKHAYSHTHTDTQTYI